MGTFVNIIYDNHDTKVTIIGRNDSLTKLPDSVLPTALHKHILPYEKFKIKLTIIQFTYKVYSLDNNYRKVTFKTARELWWREAVFSDQLFQHGWALAGLSARVSVTLRESEKKAYYVVTKWQSPNVSVHTRDIGPQKEVGCISIQLDDSDNQLVFTGREEILRLLPESVFSGFSSSQGKGPRDQWTMDSLDDEYRKLTLTRKLNIMSELKMEEHLLEYGWEPVASSFHPNFDYREQSVFHKWLAPRQNCISEKEKSAIACAPPEPSPRHQCMASAPVEAPPTYEDSMKS